MYKIYNTLYNLQCIKPINFPSFDPLLNLNINTGTSSISYMCKVGKIQYFISKIHKKHDVQIKLCHIFTPKYKMLYWQHIKLNYMSIYIVVLYLCIWDMDILRVKIKQGKKNENWNYLKIFFFNLDRQYLYAIRIKNIYFVEWKYST